MTESPAHAGVDPWAAVALRESGPEGRRPPFEGGAEGRHDEGADPEWERRLFVRPFAGPGYFSPLTTCRSTSCM